MPVHAWKLVPVRVFLSFHGSWITHLTEALNAGILPAGYYAMSEQVVPGMAVDQSIRPDPSRKPRRRKRRGREIVLRHVSRHQVIALIEIVSPGNKDRRASVRELATKVVLSLEAGFMFC